jgi:hypothetical protein
LSERCEFINVVDEELKCRSQGNESNEVESGSGRPRLSLICEVSLNRSIVEKNVTVVSTSEDSEGNSNCRDDEWSSNSSDIDEHRGGLNVMTGRGEVKNE